MCLPSHMVPKYPCRNREKKENVEETNYSQVLFEERRKVDIDYLAKQLKN